MLVQLMVVYKLQFVILKIQQQLKLQKVVPPRGETAKKIVLPQGETAMKNSIQKVQNCHPCQIIKKQTT